MNKGFMLTQYEFNFAEGVAKSFGKKFPLRAMGVDMDDLIGVANLALTNASKNYRDNKGSKFTTYAYACIKNDIFRFINKAIKENKHTIHYDQIEGQLRGLLEQPDPDADPEEYIQEFDLEEAEEKLADFLVRMSVKRKRKESKEQLRSVCRMMMKGLPPREIARNTRLSIDRVNSITMKFRDTARSNREEIEEIVMSP